MRGFGFFGRVRNEKKSFNQRVERLGEKKKKRKKMKKNVTAEVKRT
jgi:uncharacterized protein (UPF0335 family)